MDHVRGTVGWLMDKLEADANNRAFLRDPHRLEGFDWQAEQARDMATMRRQAERRILRLSRLYAAARVREEQALSRALIMLGDGTERRAQYRVARERATDLYVRLAQAIHNLAGEAF